MLLYGTMEHIPSDKNSEFMAKDVPHWLKLFGIHTRFIAPGCSWENSYIEFQRQVQKRTDKC